MKRATKLNRLRHRKFYLKAKSGGWHKALVWLSAQAIEDIHRRAALLKVPKESVLRAAAMVGLRHLTISAIQTSERKWRETMNLPVPLMVKLGYWRVKRDPITKKLLGFEPVKKEVA